MKKVSRCNGQNPRVGYSLPSTKAPAKLVILDLLRNPDLTVNRHLVAGVGKRKHEVEIHAVLGPIADLLKRTGDTGENIPALLAAAHQGGQVVHFAEGERLGHAERLGAVGEVGQEEDVLAGESLGDLRLVDTVERARRELALGVLLEDALSQAAAQDRRGGSGAGHVELDLRAKRVVVAEGNLDGLGHAGREARVNDGLLHPRLVLLVKLEEVVDESREDGVAGRHKAVAQVRVLVQVELATAEVELVLVVAVGQLLRHAAAGEALEGRLEHDLGGTTAEIEDGSGRAVVRTANLAEEVVDSDPGIDTLVGTVHHGDTVLLLGNNGEGVFALEVLADRIEDLLALLGTNQAQTGGGLDGNGRAGLELVGNNLEGSLHQGVQTLGGGQRIVLIRTQSAALALDLGGHLEENLSLQLGGGAAVVELVNVDTGTSAAGVDHGNILHDGLLLGEGSCASVGAIGRVGGYLTLVVVFKTW